MTKKILLIITGSIAAYKSVELIRILQKKSYEVEVILTKASQKFLTKLLISSILKAKIHTELFDDGQDGMSHINLSRNNDLIVVAPASADFIAKMANGYGDDLASTVILAANKKIMVAPAMNEKMWNYDATIRNIESLKKSGVIFIEPEKDELACGEVGKGKMRNIDDIFKEIEDFFELKDKLKGKKIIITGGSTREKIDPVRFISNYSSGKQAIYLTQILREMGADIELIAGNIQKTIPLNDESIFHVQSAEEMFEKTKERLENCDKNNTVFIGCAAVCDYKVKNYSAKKIKKSESENLTLELEKNVDILEYVSNSQNRPHLVIGFAAEGENLIGYAKDKLKRKKCDLIVANNIDNGKIFNNEESEAILVEENREINLNILPKIDLAKKIGFWIFENF